MMLRTISQRMPIVFRQVVRYTRNARVHRATTQRLSINDFPRGSLHQRRPAKEDRALVAHDNGFIAHRWHISTAGCTGAHDSGDLWNTLG